MLVRMMRPHDDPPISHGVVIPQGQEVEIGRGTIVEEFKYGSGRGVRC